MARSTDLRVIKTERKIKAAFWQLLIQNGFDELTIKDLLKITKINRTTFYNHYYSKYELLDQIEADLIAEFRAMASQIPNTDPLQIAHQNDSYYRHLAQFIYQNGAKMVALIGEHGDSNFMTKLLQMDKKFWQQSPLWQYVTIPQHYLMSAMIGMAVNLISEWVQGGFKESPTEFTTILQKLISPILTDTELFKNK